MICSGLVRWCVSVEALSLDFGVSGGALVELYPRDLS